MRKTLVIFAHPRYEISRSQRALAEALPRENWLTFRDLYELYPDFEVDVEEEKRLLLEHDLIIWQHPFYWYSAPPLLKQWIDMVLEFGWAYGPGGNALEGKYLFNALSAGGPRDVYQPEGRNRYRVSEFLRPFEQTVRLCHMEWLPAFVVHGTHRLSNEELKAEAEYYGWVVRQLAHSEIDLHMLQRYEYLNDCRDILKVRKV